MKKTARTAGRLLLIAVVVAGAAAAAAGAAGTGEVTSGARKSTDAAHVRIGLPGVALVELFTSEGCSSCPPAEAALSSLLAQSRASGAAVFALAWHVGYWNYLGWRDPYTLTAATERQRRYAAELSSPLYTPEIVVNGTRAASYAGDLREVTALAATARSRAATAAVTLAVRRGASPNRLEVRVTTSNAPPGSSVGVALVEDGRVDRPTAGENVGRTLEQDSVVRSFAVLPAAGGRVLFEVPAGAHLDRSRIVGFVQTASLAVAGANEIDLGAVNASSRERSLVSGRLLDRAGNGIEGAQIQACSKTLCLPAATDSAGRFSLTGVPAGGYEVKLFLPQQSGNPAAQLPLEVGPGEHVSLPAIAVAS